MTTVTAGTRVAQFMVQDLLGSVIPSLDPTTSWIGNVAGTTVAVSAWGYFLYQGVIDPFGGINSLWPLFGIANQMLAAIALIFVVAALVKYSYTRYVLIPGMPLLWLLLCTMTADIQLDEMQRLILNDRIDAALGVIFLVVVIAILGFGIRSVLQLRSEGMVASAGARA